MRENGKRRRDGWLGALMLAAALLALLPATARAAQVLRVEGYDARLVLVDGDTVHIVMEKQLENERRCYVLTEDHLLVPCERGCYTPYTSLEARTPQGTTYALNYNILRWQPDGDGAPWVAVGKKTGDMEASYNQACEDGLLILRYRVSDQGTAYQLCYDQQGEWRLAAFSLADGTGGELLRMQAYALPTAVAPDGRLVYYAQNALTAVDPSGVTRRLLPLNLNDAVSAFVSDGGDGWLVLTDRALYHVDADGGTVKLNDVPRYDADSRDAWLVLLKDRGEVLFGGTNALGKVLFCVPLAPEQNEELVIGGVDLDTVDEGQTELFFESLHPNVSVVQRRDLTDFADIAQQLTVGEGGCDLFILRTGDDGLRSVIRKGYFVDLSGVPEVAAFVTSLYPVWREEVTAADGAIGALPLGVGGRFRLGYNRVLWEELALGEVPQTYDELLDCVERWLDDGTLDGAPLCYRSRSSYANLVLELLRANAALYESRGETPVYSNDTLLALLRRLEGMRDRLNDHDARRVSGDGLLRFQWGTGPETRWEEVFEGLYPGFSDARDRGELMELYAVIINPHSSRQELARSFLQELLARMSGTTRFALVDDPLPGVEVDNYAQRLAYLVEEALPRETERLARAEQDAETTPQMMEIYRYNVEMVRQSIARMERERYVVTPEKAARYREGMEHPAVSRAGGYELLMENASSAINAFLDGKTGPEAMVRKLDEVVRMWEMENQ